MSICDNCRKNHYCIDANEDVMDCVEYEEYE